MDIHLSLDELTEAKKCITESKLMTKTPLLGDVADVLGLDSNLEVYLKLENMQINGSFKIRGVINQIEKLKKTGKTDRLFTFSAGNYGKAFSYICSLNNLPGKVLLPDTAPESRIKFMQSHGIETEKMPSSNLLSAVEEHKKNGWNCLHPFDDIDLISGYASIAFEIMENVDPDIVLVGCGGGGLLAAVSYGLAKLNSKAVVYGVEPETANTMYQSFEKGEPVKYPASKSIASGLAPPLTGTLTYKLCREYTKGGIVLVSDEEIKSACKLLYEKGLKVELSGSAALAALLNNKIPNLTTQTKENKLKIVIILSGGNISADEMAKIMQ